MNAHSANRIIGDKYVIEKPLAQGGMAAVYVAHHKLTKNRVALKILFKESSQEPGASQRFMREVSAAAEIGHDGIVKVYDAGNDYDGSFFMAMELLEGEPLSDRLERGDLSETAALTLIVELLDALAAAHAKGIVHRDLKPANVFIARQSDGSERVKLLDFGIARQLGVKSATQTGISIGTPWYMSPEQALGQRDINPAADVWAIGVMLYQIVTGILPFNGETASAIVIRLHGQPHEPVHTRAPNVDPRLVSLIDRCLSKEPQNRPQDAASVRDELAQILGVRRTGTLASISGSTPLGPAVPLTTSSGSTPLSAAGKPVLHIQPDDEVGSSTGTARAYAKPSGRRWWIAALVLVAVAAPVAVMAIAWRTNEEKKAPAVDGSSRTVQVAPPPSGERTPPTAGPATPGAAPAPASVDTSDDEKGGSSGRRRRKKGDQGAAPVGAAGDASVRTAGDAGTTPEKPSSSGADAGATGTEPPEPEPSQPPSNGETPEPPKEP